ncbi:hypothetical protein CKJ81_05975 [Corynebacterium hadale]|uniref:Uncharacterized protein n=1 Tax=Corynebacterium hadale TaxID=2026255 RepID=A0ABX4H9W1_9CORY|nr:DUF3375 family protein [Corynebacterium hadale]PAT06100.1 hypothetical protein CKJ81_05975 [Corynebacterium hadale]
MNSISVVATTLEQIRLSTSNPAWVILRAKNAPAVLAILRSVFEGDNRQVAGSDFALTVDTMLVDIREQTDMELPKTGVAYINDWVKDGYLVRRSPQGTREEL